MNTAVEYVVKVDLTLSLYGISLLHIDTYQVLQISSYILLFLDI